MQRAQPVGEPAQPGTASLVRAAAAVVRDLGHGQPSARRRETVALDASAYRTTLVSASATVK